MDEVAKPAEVSAEVKTDKVEDMVVETYEPKKNCRKCQGRGVIGYIEGDPKQPYYCTCIVKIKKTIPVKMVAKPAEPATPDEPKVSV